jgi:hypothetical protein
LAESSGAPAPPVMAAAAREHLAATSPSGVSSRRIAAEVSRGTVTDVIARRHARIPEDISRRLGRAEGRPSHPGPACVGGRRADSWGPYLLPASRAPVPVSGKFFGLRSKFVVAFGALGAPFLSVRDRFSSEGSVA